MTGTKKIVLFLLGLLNGLFILAQLALGLTIVTGKSNPQIQQVMNKLITSHQHTGYVTVALTLVYIAVSLAAIARVPTIARGERPPNP